VPGAVRSSVRAKNINAKRRRTMRKQKSNSSDCIKLRGAIEYAIKDASDGRVIDHIRGENVVLTVGRTWILQKLNSNSNTQILTRIYLGSSSTAASNTQSGLLASAASQTFNVGVTDNATSSAPHTIFCASWNSNETFTSSSVINEIGLYAGAGTAVGRYVTASAINFASTNTLTVSYTLSN
jgi:hypothetical protein